MPLTSWFASPFLCRFPQFEQSMEGQRSAYGMGALQSLQRVYLIVLPQFQHPSARAPVRTDSNCPQTQHGTSSTAGPLGCRHVSGRAGSGAEEPGGFGVNATCFQQPWHVTLFGPGSGVQTLVYVEQAHLTNA